MQASARTKGKLAVTKARAELGVKEHPAGSNRQKYGEFWRENGVAWCGLFAAYCLRMAGFPVTRELALLIDYVPTIVSMAANRDRMALVHRKRVRAGDLVCFEFTGDRTPDHVGLFSHWVDKGAGVFVTIEGNTSSGDNANGGQVQERVRYVSQVAAFVRVFAR